MRNQKKVGALLLYITTIVNTFISIFLTPFILNALGDSEYGIYRTISALTGQLALMSIGIGTITAVYVAKYNIRNDKNVVVEKENFLSIAIFTSMLIAVLVLVFGYLLYFNIDKLYQNTLTEKQLKLMKTLFVILVINIAVYLFRDVFVGIVNGYEKFIYGNSIKLLRIVIRTLLIVLLISLDFKSLGLALADLIVSIAMIISDLIYCFSVLKVKVKFRYFDKELFKSIFTFSIAIFLQAIVNQVNQNLDSVILGAMIIPERVAVYSLALTLYIAFNSLSSALSSLFTPEASKLIQNNVDKQKLMDFCIKVGRYQLLLTSLITGGFIVVGKEFVNMWVGIEKIDVYYISIILILPVCVSNLFSGANSILDAYMKRLGRSVILVITALYNIVVSIVMIKYIDYWGAAIGTASSVIIGQIFLMSLYYKKVFGFHLKEFILKTIDGVLLSTVIAGIASYSLNILHLENTAMLLIKGSVFSGIYIVCLLLFGMKKNEKKAVFGSFNFIR